ncbi:spore coat protein [Paenibacillus sambharensis]|uniref:Spore coat protein n=1 Tax=Paenibacillus sambharensis TaxID=1803190 RepID=A0A2W1LTW4_9BACL|nr:spore coat protein [Paenibacillus sambharensis]PZD94907.1 spore coat protein [Paenibacillus sambharensis]
MNALVENMTGMNVMTDKVIAADFLITAKSGVRNLSYAITEAATPEVRNMLKRQLNTAIDTHEQISNYMISKGWYNPGDAKAQIQMDLDNAQLALKVAQG